MGLKSKQHGPGNVNVQIGDGAQLSNNVIKVSGGALHEGSLFNLNTTQADTPDTLADPSDITPDTQTLDLFRTLTRRFNLEELETVCWELGLKFEDLSAQTLSGKARQLVEKAAAQGVLDGLHGIVRLFGHLAIRLFGCFGCLVVWLFGCLVVCLVVLVWCGRC